MRKQLKKHGPLIGVIFISIILHMVFLMKNPGIGYNDPSVYSLDLRQAYGDIVIKYGGYDAVNYGKSAEQLVSKGFLGFVSEEPNAYTTPGQPIYLATNILLCKLFGWDYIEFTKIINLFLSVATAVLLYLIGSRLFNKLTGLVSAFFYALYFPPLHFFRSLLSETPSIFLFCLSIFILVLAIQKNKAKYHIIFGILFSITIMFRPAITPMVIVPIIAVLMKYGARRSLIIAGFWAIGPLMVIAPWVLRNAIVLNSFILFSTQKNPFFAGTIPFFVENYNQIYQELVDSGLSESEFGKLRIRNGLETNPILWISWYTVGKTMYLFRRPAGWTDYWIIYSEFTSIFYAYHFLIILLAILAILFLRNQKEIKALGISLVIYIIVSNIFVVDERYGFFVMPLVILLGASMLSILIKRIYSIISVRCLSIQN